MTEEFVSRIPPQLRESLLRGKAAAEIGWGSEGDFDRCVSFLRRHDVPERMVKGECATLHHAATGKWPGAGRSHSGDTETFATQVHTGAMIALIPSAADAERLCLEGGEELGDMHLTLAYLGDAAEWSDSERFIMASEVEKALGSQGPVHGEAFALAYFNPGDNGKETALVYGIGGTEVDRVHRTVRHAAGNTYGPKVPDQHMPFTAHVTAKYTDDLDEHHGLVDRLGPITFDTVRLAFAGDHYDIPLRETVDLDALVASMGNYSPVTWFGPLAPIGTPTGDKRIFPPATLTYQTFPMPLRFQRKGMPGHDGAVVVGRILHAEEGEWKGLPYIVGRGDWFNPDIVPEVTEAMALVEGGVSGPSVDLDSFAASVKEYAGKPVLSVHEGRVRGATLVSIPAFADLRLELQYPEVADEPVDPVTLVASVQEFASVNDTGWKGAPVAPRDAEFDADDAVARIEDFAGVGGDSPDESKMRKMFLWIDPQGAPLDRAGYRLPWGDIIDGKPYLIYHAIYAAAALLEGGHGGLPNIPDPDKARLRTVISSIYAKLATEFGDPNIQASWDKAQEKADNATKAAVLDAAEFKYTESKHPRDPGGEDGGEWVDVPGHGPHGEITKGGKKSGGDEDSGGGKSESKAPAKKSGESKGTLTEKAALDSAPVKLDPGSGGGHGGNYDEATATGPKGMGSVKALAEMEGVEHEVTNNWLRRGGKDLPSQAPQIKERIAEVDKSMAVSPLPNDVTAHRGVKDGSQTFGEDAWYGFAFDGDTREEQDANWARWQSGERPDLTGLTWTEKGYSHTTVAEDKVAGYAKKVADLEPVAMKISVPKGTQGIQMSGMDKEAELMLQRGLKYRVTKDHGVDSSGVRRLDVEVVRGGD
jgi:hypothetical protein